MLNCAATQHYGHSIGLYLRPYFLLWPNWPKPDWTGGRTNASALWPKPCHRYMWFTHRTAARVSAQYERKGQTAIRCQRKRSCLHVILWWTFCGNERIWWTVKNHRCDGDMVEQFAATTRLTHCDPQELAESAERKPRRNIHLQVRLLYVELHLIVSSQRHKAATLANVATTTSSRLRIYIELWATLMQQQPGSAVRTQTTWTRQEVNETTRQVANDCDLDWSSYFPLSTYLT